MNRRTIANMITFVVVGGLFFFWAATRLVNVSAIKHPYTLQAEFSNAVGLLPGSEVDYLGVTYGTVSSVERIDGGVRVSMKVDKGKVDITSSSPDLGEAKETLPVDYSGPAMQICFNAQYVLDFLAAVSTDVVSLDLKDEVSQAVMKPVGAEGYDYTYVIMPMRV